MKDTRFPWIDFPDNPKGGQLWRVRSKVMPVFTIWQYRRDAGWDVIEDA